MTWAAFVGQWASEWLLPPRYADDLLRSAFLNIELEARAGERINVPGFGVFSLRQRGEKRVVAPNGGEHQVPAHSVVAFKASKSTKARRAKP